MKNNKLKFKQKYTKKGKSYWNSNGVYQEEFNKFLEKMPEMDKADTLNIELIRCINNLSYEYYNNGNCNAKKYSSSIERYDCFECGGEGEIEAWEGFDDDEEVVIETCQECMGTGELDEEFDEVSDVSSHFQEMLDFISGKISNTTELTETIRDIIINDDPNYKKEEAYVKLTDIVVNYCINNEDVKL